jgi:hypothetical protein
MSNAYARTVAGENLRASRWDKNAFADSAPAHVPSSLCEPSLRVTATAIAKPPRVVPRFRMNPDPSRPGDLKPRRRVGPLLAG